MPGAHSDVDVVGSFSSRIDAPPISGGDAAKKSHPLQFSDTAADGVLIGKGRRGGGYGGGDEIGLMCTRSEDTWLH